MQQTLSAERGVNFTMLAFIINAVGGSLPPVFVFARQKVAPSLFEKGPLGCFGLAHESGYDVIRFQISTTFTLFCQVLQRKASYNDVGQTQ